MWFANISVLFGGFNWFSKQFLLHFQTIGNPHCLPKPVSFWRVQYRSWGTQSSRGFRELETMNFLLELLSVLGSLRPYKAWTHLTKANIWGHQIQETCMFNNFQLAQKSSKFHLLGLCNNLEYSVLIVGSSWPRQSNSREKDGTI